MCTYAYIEKKSSGSCNDINDPYAKLCVPVIFVGTTFFDLFISKTHSLSTYSYTGVKKN